MKKRILAAILSALIACGSMAALPVVYAEEAPQEESAVQTVNRGTISIEQGKSSDLSGKITSGNNLVEWSSSDWSVVDISNGTITGLKQGTTTITATIMDESYTPLRIETFTIVVKAPVVRVNGIILNRTSFNTDIGKKITMKATVSPSDATNKKVTWSVSNPNVASVSSSGIVTAKKTGFSYIYAKADGRTKACRMFVRFASPASPKASVVNSSTLKVTWKKVSGANKYYVFRSTKKASGYKKVATVTTNAYTSKGLKANTAYYYKITAQNANSNYGSRYSSVCAATTKLAKPAKVSKSSVINTSAKISWSKVSGAKGYQLYRSTSKNGTYSKVKTTSSTSFTNKKLTPNKTYYYKVRAYKIVNGKTFYGDYSSILAMKTKPNFVINDSMLYKSVKVSSVFPGKSKVTLSDLKKQFNKKGNQLYITTYEEAKKINSSGQLVREVSPSAYAIYKSEYELIFYLDKNNKASKVFVKEYFGGHGMGGF